MDGRKNNKTKIVFTLEQEEYIRAHFATEAACDIAEHFGCSPAIVVRAAREMGLKKAKTWSVGKYRGRYTSHYVNTK